MAQRYAYFEGKFVPIDEANINIQTNSFHYGTAIFEGIRAYWNEEKNQLFGLFFKKHYERMVANCKILNMKLDKTVDELTEITVELLRRCEHKENVYIRPIAYFPNLQISPKLIGYDTELAIYTVPLGDYLDTKKGLKVITSSFRRINDSMIPARCKVAGAYVNSAFAKTEAILAGADEAIMLNTDGTVAEGSAENLFIIRNGVAITTPSYSNILEGITRNAVIELLKEELGVEVVERPILRSELYIADEAFFTGTGAQVAPIAEIDGRVIGTGEIGKITSKLQELYFDIVKGNVDKYSHWLIPIY
ncbi:branched-chain amino acid transaminase [Desulfurobacterium atlanticum]|uniref:Branched-chain-amino-acid aminotransferase n=1 Tax=Desulfurobacterium atlanticum TaxID=240169 RepID=A0A238Y513_9BACT|nr:branched-chain amino acid transaminase [Desulfurobacterium atlanticum]SNR66207.1 branched-chain amino acid aminotransferase [Desulfurobacterium atlanticum]